MESPPPHVVILGAGFGGLYAARGLRGAPVEVTVVDRRNHHLFQPLLYQVATAGLNPGDIAAPIRKILRRQKNARVLLGEAEQIKVDSKTVVLSDATISYDYLVVATGATHSYFGRDEWARDAPGLKTLEDALEIRRRLLLAYEAAEREDSKEIRRAWLTFVIVGGGPTGVELAGSLAEISRHALAEDFRRIDPRDSRIILVEGLERILPTFHPTLSAKARRSLERLGIEVVTEKKVEAIDSLGVTIGGESIRARTVLWAAGVAASPLAKSLGAGLDRAGRVMVEPDLTVPGHPDIFVIGDLAAVSSGGKPVPGVAPAAIQEGRHTAKNIRRTLSGKPHKPFRFANKGMLATVGRAEAVAEFPNLRTAGFVAWIIWVVVHIYFLIGFRNRLIVMFQWTWAYLTWERGARLITGETDHLLRRPEPD